MDKIRETYEFLKEKCPFSPEIGVILGTGLGGLVEKVNINCEIPYDDIPNFPVSTVESHHGRLIFGTLEGKSVVVMQGRFHYYEGYSMQQVTFPVRVMKLLGIKHLLVSNAAGGLNEGYQISDLMIINDHINLFPENPLTGPNLDELGPRFPDMSEPYSHQLLKLGVEIGDRLDANVHQGVYAAVSGPNLESPAEYKYLRIIGADAIGMSTIPEVIVARHMDLPVFATSVITDLGYPGAIEKVDVARIIAAANKAEPSLTRLFSELIRLT
ncbi:MAG: purine-nucleoside phosphorylase [Bacteroidota bacterium]